VFVGSTPSRERAASSATTTAIVACRTYRSAERAFVKGIRSQATCFRLMTSRFQVLQRQPGIDDRITGRHRWIVAFPAPNADAMGTFGDSLLLIEGAGRLDKVTGKGDDAQIETIQDGFTEPVSVTQVGNTGWVAEGKLSCIIGDNKTKDPGPFTIKPASMSK
jgi:hypothetical protein